VLTRDCEPFNHVVQFPHIAGPVVVLQDASAAGVIPLMRQP
jgi:hypothetical protein